MTGEAKLENIAAQIAACEEGRTNVITCPYCGAANKQEDGTFCCSAFTVSVSAVLDRKDLEDRQRHLDAVAEKASRN